MLSSKANLEQNCFKFCTLSSVFPLKIGIFRCRYWLKEKPFPAVCAAIFRGKKPGSIMCDPKASGLTSNYMDLDACFHTLWALWRNIPHLIAEFLLATFRHSSYCRRVHNWRNPSCFVRDYRFYEDFMWYTFQAMTNRAHHLRGNHLWLCSGMWWCCAQA